MNPEQYFFPIFEDGDISEKKCVELLMMSSQFMAFTYTKTLSEVEGSPNGLIITLCIPLFLCFGEEFIDTMLLLTEQRLGYNLPEVIKASVLSTSKQVPVEESSLSDEIIKGFYEEGK